MIPVIVIFSLLIHLLERQGRIDKCEKKVKEDWDSGERTNDHELVSKIFCRMVPIRMILGQ